MNIQENIPLKPLNTFKVGGKARFFVEVKDRDDFLEVANFLDGKSLPFFILGGGSNVLISDMDYPGLVLKISTSGIEWREMGDKIEVSAEAGVDWDFLVSETVKRNLYGLENLSGIPGTVGGAPIQNIGAYGREIKDTLAWVEIFDLKEKKFKILNFNDLNFSYRNSIFKKPEAKDWVVTKAAFYLAKKGEIHIAYKDLKNYFGDNTNPSLAEVREAVLKIRSKKFPDLKVYGTAGSFFQNPIVSLEKLNELKDKFGEVPNFPAGEKFKVPAAWILDNVFKLKGQNFDQVSFFINQPLVVVNLGGASASEIKNVTDTISARVEEELGIVLEREVRLIGDFF